MEITDKEIRKGCMTPFKGRLLSAFFMSGLCVLSSAAYLLCDLLINRSALSGVFKTAASAIGLWTLMSVFYIVLSWYYRVVAGTETALSKLIMSYAVLSVIYIFDAVLFFSLPFFVTVLAEMLPGISEVYSVLYTFTETALYVITALFLFSFEMRYFPVPFIIMEHRNLKLREVFGKSRAVMKNRRFSGMCFIIKSLLYLIPCVLIVPSVYFLPKMFSGIALYGKYLLEKAECKSTTSHIL